MNVWRPVDVEHAPVRAVNRNLVLVLPLLAQDNVPPLLEHELLALGRVEQPHAHDPVGVVRGTDARQVRGRDVPPVECGRCAGPLHCRVQFATTILYSTRGDLRS